MKKLIFILLAALSINAMAHEPTISMYKKHEVKKTKKQKLLNGNTAGGWAIVGGGAIFAGSMLKVFTVNLPLPDVADFTDLQDYKNSLDKYNDNQKNINTGFYSCLALGGFCFLISGIELSNRPVVYTEKVSLNISSSSNGVGLCLNFK